MKEKEAKHNVATSIVPADVFKPAEGLALVCGSKLYLSNADRRTLYPNCVGMDMLEGPGVDRVGDLSDPFKIKRGEFSHVDCVSVLEHCANPWKVADNLLRGMRAGATLLVSAPWMWRYHGYPHDYYRYTPDGIRALFPGIEWTFLKLLSNGTWHEGRTAPRIKAEEPLFHRCEVVGWGFK